MGMLLRRHNLIGEAARQSKRSAPVLPPKVPVPKRTVKSPKPAKTPETPAIAPIALDVEHEPGAAGGFD